MLFHFFLLAFWVSPSNLYPVEDSLDHRDRLEGMVYGTVIGDAAGGPLEFRARNKKQEPVYAHNRKRIVGKLKENFQLMAYKNHAAPYAQWEDYALAGTITDDTRFKILFMQALRRRADLSANEFAWQILQYEDQFSGSYRQLCQRWLSEFKLAARWQLGQGGLPPDRMWAGLPSLAGQMPFLLVAGLYPAKPLEAYQKAWELNFFDTGYAKDTNASIVAGLAAAFSEGANWEDIEKAIRNTDPYQFGNAVYGERAVTKWLDFTHWVVKRSGNCPNHLFRLIEQGVQAEQWWECWVPLVVVFACAEFTGYDPIASMQLVLEFGHDTDSYAQLMGAFMGALHGKRIFREEWCRKVRWRMIEQFGEDIEDWVEELRIES